MIASYPRRGRYGERPLPRPDLNALEREKSEKVPGAALAFAITVYGAGARAGDMTPPSYADTTLTGDWHGYRNWLRDQGVTFTVSQTMCSATCLAASEEERPMTVFSNCRATSTWAGWQAGPAAAFISPVMRSKHAQVAVIHPDAAMKIMICRCRLNRHPLKMKSEHPARAKTSGTPQTKKHLYGVGLTGNLIGFFAALRAEGGLVNTIA
ncbi:hypothetical protein [Rhizobium sp. BT-175]|uniref:hypothetical protein n=1 Tax=Rhizobium sp. BT-175 TaxID=2986929 RepID=UPI0022354743|nr:hypothetical protein [Rhizobium sp. BT-175]MCV9945088.1 hypothetical protein [Rhizobium sp. BT-175]